jgi:acyl carrier protein
VVLKKGLNATVEELKQHVTKQVPAYMVPSVFMILEAMPLTPNGKVDRGAFPVPELSRHSSQDSFVAPTLPLHSQLVQIWEELLDARPIGTQDNFFDLGGHSLLAARLVMRIERDYGKKIPLNTLLADATVERLAEVIMQPEDESFGSSATEISLKGKTGISKTKKGLFGRVAGAMNRRAGRESE